MPTQAQTMRAARRLGAHRYLDIQAVNATGNYSPRPNDSSMNVPGSRCHWLALCVAVTILAGCGGAQSPIGPPGVQPLEDRLGSNSGGSSNYIQHVVIVIQENRSFDNLFATFPGVDGAVGGCMKPPAPRGAHFASSSGKCPGKDTYIPLRMADLPEPCDLGHGYLAFLKDWDHTKMDGFDLEGGGMQAGCAGPAGTKPYQYVDPTQIQPYWTMASQYVLADHMYQTQGSGSFTAHQDLIAGGTTIDPSKTESLVDFPSSQPWGCDNKTPTTVTSLLVSDPPKQLKREYHKGPFPCLSYATLRDLLDAKSVSWKYYSPPEPNGTGALWNAFDAIDAVREGPEWNTNIRGSNKFLTDVSSGSLSAVSWVVPDDLNSDHPGPKNDMGPSWVASIVNAVGESPYWTNTAIVIVWDDWGGFYDNKPPPFFDQWGGLGFRVPMIVVSAYARQGKHHVGFVSHTRYEFGSILKFVENVWGLGQLGTTDTRAQSIVDCFDFTQPPRTFVPIGSKYSRAYFLRQKPSYLPVDSE